MYAKYVKRPLDFLLSLAGLIVLSPVLLVMAAVGAVVMRGNPFFAQVRPGKDEKLFRLVKFRSMTNRRDANGEFLPDEQRLTAYGKFIRDTSLDELPELWNILKGEMSIVGPRPQLVRDMVFMTDNQRRRHSVRQGLTGLAQCSGRNAISWEHKMEYDLQYIGNITFMGDVRIIFKTVKSVFVREGIRKDDMATSEDLGDYLLRTGQVSPEDYERKQQQAAVLIAWMQGTERQ